ncbi:PA4780 family RIO1-like protein kinase [Moritella sp. F3]|uniref:PA4780 family RIO1-like protein kinase n=1 Tax=Moritella sp. F3 TaxID=2718882 RepID=UPI0018E0DFB2|nr:PA4780 family RIO1-like protein kinase [Moritella sp. F3]GIC79022.1 serine/threonine protein kinase [Moritella sp. F1]GIC83454.1 serine/threonine protein kinase [Moritella sp. F3]
MKVPQRIQPLVDDGLVDEVVRQLMSGKEATVYVVRCGQEIRCAKVYKEVEKRSFKQAVQYREGRKVRNSRRARAMEKGSSFGRNEQEKVWQNAEVEALYRLDNAGVRVPEPYGCFDGVLLMELVTDADGFAAPRLADVVLTPEQAIIDHDKVIHFVKLMLCAGLIHGDLSEFNVLVDEHGPVIIDLPQAVDASANNNAKWMLERDVENMRLYYGQFAPQLLELKYAKEMWALYELGELNADVELTGEFVEDTTSADVGGILDEINAAREEELDRLARIQSADEVEQ